MACQSKRDNDEVNCTVHEGFYGRLKNCGGKTVEKHNEGPFHHRDNKNIRVHHGVININYINVGEIGSAYEGVPIMRNRGPLQRMNEHYRSF